MSEDITLFNAGDKVTAEETNKNNQLLKGWALDDKATQSWVTSQLSSLSSTLTSQINSVSNGAVKTTGNQSIAGNKTFSGTVKIPNSAAAGTAVSTAAISKGGNGYVKFGNGIIIQWGTGTMKNANTTITFPIAFNSVARVSLTKVTNSDGRTEDWWIKSVTKTNFVVRSSETDGNHWIAIGY